MRLISAQPLADRLVEQDGGRSGGVEGIELAPHGDTDLKIAALGHQTAHSRALAADDDGGGTLQIRVIEAGGTVRLGAEDPQALLLELL